MTYSLTENLKQWAESQVDMVNPIDGISAKNDKGDAFVTLCCGGVKSQGGKFPLFASTIDLAEQLWKQSFLEYLSGLRIEGPKKLYWRRHPGLVDDGGGYFSIIARLVVTNA